MNKIIETSYTRHKPFLSTIIDRYCLNRTASQRETWHVVLDLQGSGICYTPGDSIAILPQNDCQQVERILAHIQATGDENIDEERGTLRSFLLNKAKIEQAQKKLLV